MAQSSVDTLLEPLFAPRSIAVVGASARMGRPGFAVLEGLRRMGFPGAVLPVTPTYEHILDWECLPSIDAVPGAVDLVVLAGSGDRVESELADVIELGARSVYVVGRPPRPQHMAGLARDAGIPLLGGASMGFVNYAARVSATWGPPVSTVAGSVAVIAQSGTIFLEANTGDPRLGLCFTAHPGQEAGVDVASMIHYALGLPQTRVIGLYLETATDPEALERSLDRATSLDVPIVAIRPGRTERSQAALSTHAGRLAGTHASFEALFRRYAVTFVSSTDQFWTTLACFSHPRRFGPGGVAALTDSGGERAILLDTADDVDLDLPTLGDATTRRLEALLGPALEPQNPVDIWDGHTDMRSHTADCIRAVAADDAVGAVLVCCAFGAADVDPGGHPNALGDACRIVSAETTKPVYAASYSSRQLEKDAMLRLAEAGIPVLDGLPAALQACRHALEFRDRLRREPPASVELPAVDLEREPLDVLRDLGLPAVPVAVAASEAAAVAAAHRFGCPVVLKTGEAIAHKTEADGVKVGLRDEAEVRAAYRDLCGRLGSRVVVSPHIRGDVEIALGIAPGQFGPMLVISAGGTLVEVLDDRRWLLAPATPEEIERALVELKVYRVLQGVRGRPSCDIAGLCQIAAQLSTVAYSLRETIVEIDLNPVIVGPEGCTIVDALFATPQRKVEVDH